MKFKAVKDVILRKTLKAQKIGLGFAAGPASLSISAVYDFA